VDKGSTPKPCAQYIAGRNFLNLVINIFEEKVSHFGIGYLSLEVR